MTTTQDVCVCGHAQEAHQHFRSGTDCSLCPRGECDRYRPTGGFRAAIRRIIGR